MPEHKKIQIGVLGCSRVAKKYFFPYVSSSELADVEFIGSRALEKAQEYAMTILLLNMVTMMMS